MIFDTHVHYDDEKFDGDREELIQSLFANGIGAFVNVSADMRSLDDTVKLAGEHENVYGALGLHPSDVPDTFDATGLTPSEMPDTSDHLAPNGEEEKVLNKIRTLMADNEKMVAIGEIGLDYHYPDFKKDLQQRWFRLQLALARELKKPVIIHSRDAAADTYAIMKEENAGELGGVVHCFSYSPEMALEYVKMGFFIGIGGVLTYKNAKKLKEVAARVPLDNIVLETDCPYLAPEPHRGKRNSSLYLPFVVEALSEIKGVSKAEIEKVTWENAVRLYRL